MHLFMVSFCLFAIRPTWHVTVNVISEHCGYKINPVQRTKQCTYNVTLRRVRVTILAVKKHEVSHISSKFF